VTLTLSNPSAGAEIDPAQGTATLIIVDDDAAAPAIPTASETALMLLAMLLALTALRSLRP
jgi:hypothetical protein